jgi:hypothetical protein
MKTANRSSIGEFRFRDQEPFIRRIKIDIDQVDRTFTHQSLSINASAITLQVPMNSPLFDRLPACFRNDTPTHIYHEDLGKKRVVLRHTRRYRAILTKWIFSFTESVSTRKLKKLSPTG